MKLKLKSRRVIGRTLAANFSITLLVVLIFVLFNVPWNILDYKLNDFFHKKIIEEKKGPDINGRIIFLNITDESYNSFGSNALNRGALAEVNNVLSRLNPEAVFYDIIFPRTSSGLQDSLFALSIKQLGNVFLPAGFQLTNEPRPFRWESGVFFEKLQNYISKIPEESGRGEPYSAVWALPQKDEFAKYAVNSGHISLVRDKDGILRHFPLLIKIDSLYFPTISLSIFLNYNKVPFDKIKIRWGESIVIPAVSGSYLDSDVTIPIDNNGKAFIPYYGFWSDGSSKMMEVQNLLEYLEVHEYYDDLLDFFEGGFVFISDISVGTSDLGQTSIEENVPLVTVHAALLNGMLNNQFYTQWDILPLVLIILLSAILLAVSSLLRTNLFIYITTILLLTVIIFYGYNELLSRNLFPAFSIAISVFVIFLGLVISIEVITSKDRAFIKNAFSRYVPEKIIDRLIENPEQLRLGGETRKLTILFSDISDFTSISEKMKPEDLVSHLNEYFTEMTKIIIKREGTIDKYIGDAILAEFGAPVMIEEHADAAVSAAILMQKKLKEMEKIWKEKKFPILSNRIGINTGEVVIGNMGSDQVFDYTAVGDPVNLAARLEGANKFYNTKILISGFTFKALTPGLCRTRLLDVIKVKGKETAVKVYEVYGVISDHFSEEDLKYYDLYDAAFNFYLSKKFNEATEYFTKALQLRPYDYSAAELIKRIKVIHSSSINEDWDGSISYKEK